MQDNLIEQLFSKEIQDPWGKKHFRKSNVKEQLETHVYSDPDLDSDYEDKVVCEEIVVREEPISIIQDKNEEKKLTELQEKPKTKNNFRIKNVEQKVYKPFQRQKIPTQENINEKIIPNSLALRNKMEIQIRLELISEAITKLQQLLEKT